MENNKLTVFQKINRALKSNNPRSQSPYDSSTPLRSELLTGSSIEDYNSKKLELNQNDYLNTQYESVRKTVYQDNLYYETNRLSSYIDFEAMEYFPEIAAALDIYAEESTPLNEKGKVLSVYSESDRVKTILEDLFYKILDINTNLPSWSRNLCKYGDNFLYLRTELEKGITGAVQLKNVEITRKEIDDFSEEESRGVTFEWQSKNLQFTNFQIAHFRRVDDDRKLPYGTSILEKCRKIFKQLSLLEDAVLIYRITRAPERRVFKINVGNTDDKDVDNLVAKIAQKFKKSSLINSQNGQIDYRTATLSTDMDYFVPVRDGNQGTVIDTLAGASNLGEISDLTFFQNKLFAALRVPKSFLNFEEAAGDGKNLALQDVRFLQPINRIQQCLIQELNKIAIIHLMILGFEDELDNFKLTLATPSIQADILRIEQLNTKLDAYLKAVTPVDGGFAPYSVTKAKKEILNMTDDEIILDIKQQRFEKIVALENDTETLKTKLLKSGLFDLMDQKFAGTEPLAPQAEEGSGGGGGPSGGGGGMPDLGAPDDFGGDDDPGDAPLPPEVGDNPPADAPVDAPISENRKGLTANNLNAINESVNKNIKFIDDLLR